MTTYERHMDKIRGLNLLGHLSPGALDRILEESAELLYFATGELIFAQGQLDQYISYLLEGRVERTRDNIVELVMDADKHDATRPLDAMAQKESTMRASSPAVILRLLRRELERANADVEADDDSGLESPIKSFISPAPSTKPRPAEQLESSAMVDIDHNGASNASRRRDGHGESQPTPASHPDAVPSYADTPVSREDFADTITGRELADIIDDLSLKRREFEPQNRDQLDEKSPPTGQSTMAPVTDMDANRVDLGFPESLIDDMVSDINKELTRSIKQSMATRFEEMAAKLKEYAARLERVSHEKVNAHEIQIHAHFEELYKDRENKLRADFERLSNVANKMARQKADIQLTRKRLAETLKTANRVHQAVYRAGATLVSQVGHLGEVDEDKRSS